MAAFLANYYQGWVVREIAREYLSRKNAYDVTDILEIAKRQIQEEEKIVAQAQKGQFVFCDTELINIKIWLEDKNYEVPAWISEAIGEADYDLYFLTKPDLPWVWDPLRENKDRAVYFFHLFMEELQQRNKKFEIIEGFGKAREEKAIQLVNKFYF